MGMKILFFGQLTDITGIDSIDIDTAADTDTLIEHLQDTFPGLSGSKFIVAVNKQQIAGNTPLTPESSIVLMPPFSGG
jgi:molybdopterin synthase sulfur carrier subunit